MALQYFDTNILGAYIIDAWQNHLGTESDPAGGKWFRNGPGNGPGLFGGLTETLRTDLVFDKGQATLNKTKDVALSTTLDNRLGLLTDSAATSTLSWQMTNSSTATHSISKSVKSGLSQKLTFKGKWGLVEVGSETTINFEYTHSWTDSSANTQTDTKTFTTAIPLKVPQGKAYKLVVVADRNAIKIPYSAQILLTGTSEANFSATVTGQKNWKANAGEMCRWINQYGSADEDSVNFDADPLDPTRGIASMRGTMNVDNAVNFTIFALDVTSTLNGDPSAAGLVAKLVKGEKLPDGVLVAATPVGATPGA